MDDRHSISSPRPVCTDNSHLSWEVDVYRENVPEPVDTILIDEKTLPPRKRKNKIVWRLPTEAGKIPSFGTDEKRRIMDLFKERKRGRRKMKRSSSTAGEIDGTAKEAEKPTRTESDYEKKRREIEERVREAKMKEAEKERQREKEKEKNMLEKGKEMEKGEKEKERIRLEQEETFIKQEKIRKELELEKSKLMEEKEKMELSMRKLKEEEQRIKIQKEKQEKQSKKTKTRDEPQAPAPTREKEKTKDRPHDQNNPMKPNQNGSIHLIDDDSPSLKPTPPAENSPPSPGPVDNNLTKNPLSDPPGIPLTSKYILIPSQPPSPTILSAKKFVQLYYPYLTHGLTHPLSHYFTPTAQKSVSVGGAHSVVTGHSAILSQISSLSGSVFSIIGVVAQDADGGVHILVTGVCKTQGVESAFAHSVGLVRSFEDESWVGFRIQNDALALLKDVVGGGEGCVAPSQGMGEGVGGEGERVVPPPGLFG